MIPRYSNSRSWRWLALACASAACGAFGRHDAPQDSTSLAVATPAPKPPPDVMRLLALDAALSPANAGARMTCIPIDAAGQSRLIYMLLPAESSYVRLTVVSARGAIEMVDLVRGIPDGRIWSATAEG